MGLCPETERALDRKEDTYWESNVQVARCVNIAGSATVAWPPPLTWSMKLV